MGVSIGGDLIFRCLRQMFNCNILVWHLDREHNKFKLWDNYIYEVPNADRDISLLYSGNGENGHYQPLVSSSQFKHTVCVQYMASGHYNRICEFNMFAGNGVLPENKMEQFMWDYWKIVGTKEAGFQTIFKEHKQGEKFQ